MASFGRTQRDEPGADTIIIGLLRTFEEVLRSFGLEPSAFPDLPEYVEEGRAELGLWRGKVYYFPGYNGPMRRVKVKGRLFEALLRERIRQVEEELVRLRACEKEAER